jgi:hypothetical protein
MQLVPLLHLGDVLRTWQLWLFWFSCFSVIGPVCGVWAVLAELLRNVWGFSQVGL